MVVLVDTNVVIDFLATREPFYKVSTEVIMKCASGEMITLYHEKQEKFSQGVPTGVTVYHVWPQHSLKGIFKINPDLTQRRIDEGYEAASKSLKSGFFQ